MKTLVFDVMLDGRFVHTFRYQYCPLFPIDEQELEKFVTDRLPTLKGKDLNIPMIAETGSFIAGAEWQSKQSPWISVNERLPEPNKLVLCRMVSNGAIVSGYIVVSSGRSPYVATDGGFERLRV